MMPQLTKRGPNSPELAEIQQLKVAVWALRGQLEASKALHDGEFPPSDWTGVWVMKEK